MLWMFIAIATVELLIVHFLLVLWKPWIALAVSTVSLCAIVWIVALILSFRRRPVRIENGLLLLRAGMLKGIAVPLDQVAGVRSAWTAAKLKSRAVLNLALLAWPNVMIELAAPVPIGRRAVGMIAHKLDDPAAFTAAIRALERPDG